MKGNNVKSKPLGGNSNQQAVSDQSLQEKIAKKAYELFEQRGWDHGNDQKDWYEAEKIILNEEQAPKKRRTIAAKRFVI